MKYFIFYKMFKLPILCGAVLSKYHTFNISIEDG
jgi:hypothetical protein